MERLCLASFDFEVADATDRTVSTQVLLRVSEFVVLGFLFGFGVLVVATVRDVV
jgi:hypothetical protein